MRNSPLIRWKSLLIGENCNEIINQRGGVTAFASHVRSGPPRWRPDQLNKRILRRGRRSGSKVPLQSYPPAQECRICSLGSAVPRGGVYVGEAALGRHLERYPARAGRIHVPGRMRLKAPDLSSSEDCLMRDVWLQCERENARCALILYAGGADGKAEAQNERAVLQHLTGG